MTSPVSPIEFRPFLTILYFLGNAFGGSPTPVHDRSRVYQGALFPKITPGGGILRPYDLLLAGYTMESRSFIPIEVTLVLR
jgi:hypothetical protein